MLVSMVVTFHLEQSDTRLSCFSLSDDELLGVDTHDANTQKIGAIRAKINKTLKSPQCTGQPRLVLSSGLVNLDCNYKTVADFFVYSKLGRT